MADERIRVVITGSSEDLARALRTAGVEVKAFEHTVGSSSSRVRARVEADNRKSAASYAGLSSELRKVNADFTFFRNAVSLVKFPAMITGAGLAAQGLSALGAGAVAVTGALGPLVGVLAAIPSAMAAAGQAAGTFKLATFGVADAVKALVTEHERAGISAQSSANQQSQAAEQIRSSEIAVANAQRTSKYAQESLTQARVEARARLEELTAAADRSRMTEERASLSFKQAQDALVRARNDPTSSGLDIRDLELRVREARAELDDTRKTGQQERKDAEQAKKDGVKGSDQVVAARRQVRDAERGVAEAQHQATLAQKAANDAMNDQATAADNAQIAMARLSPASQHFVRTLLDMKPLLDDLRSTAAEGFFPGAENGLHSVAENFDVIKAQVGSTAEVLGHLAEDAGKQFGSSGWAHNFQVIGDQNVQTIDRLGKSGLNWADVLGDILVEAEPLIDWLGKAILEYSRLAKAQSSASRTSGGMHDFFEETVDVGKQVVDILTHVGHALFEIGAAGKQNLGDDILKSLDDEAQRLDAWTSSLAGQNALEQYFTDAKPAVYAMGNLLEHVVGMFFRLGNQPGVAQLITQIDQQLLPVLEKLVGTTTQAFGPRLVNALINVVELFGDLVGTTGPLTAFIDIVGAVAGGLHDLFQEFPHLKDDLVLLLTVGSIYKALGIASAISGMKSFIALTREATTAVEGLSGAEAVSGGVGAASGAAGAAGAAGGLARAGESVTRGGVILPKGVAPIAEGVAATGAASKLLPILGRVGRAAGPAGAVLMLIDATDAAMKVADAADRLQHENPSTRSGWMQGLVDTKDFVSNSNRIASMIPSVLGPALTNGFQMQEAALTEAIRKGLQPAIEGGVVAAMTGVSSLPTFDFGGSFVDGFVKDLALAKDYSKKGVAGILDELGKVKPGTEENFRAAGLSAIRELRKAGVITASEAKRMRDQVNHHFDELEQDSKDMGRGMESGILNAWRKIDAGNDQLARSFDGLGSDVGDAMDTLTGAVHNGLREIEKQLNDAMGALGLKAGIAFSAGAASKGGSGGKAQVRARGGRVQGEGLQDTVPVPGTNAIVAPGELLWVSNRHTESRLDQMLAPYGTSLENEVLNETKPHYAPFTKGGLAKSGLAAGVAKGSKKGLPEPNFGGHPSNVNQSVARLISIMQSQFPLGVSSTTDHSATTSSGNPSDHAVGAAVDLAGSSSVMYKASEWIKSSGLYRDLKQGIHNPNLAVNAGEILAPPGIYAGQTWAEHVDHIHLAATGAITSALGAGNFAEAERIGRILLKGPDGPLKAIGQAALDKVRAASNDYLGNQQPDLPAGFSSKHGPIVKGRYDKNDLMGLAKSVGVSNPGLMAAIALAESAGDPASRNVNTDGSIDLGLWQINSVHGYANSQLLDPMGNAKAMAEILSSQGLTAWATYNNHSYQQFLAKGGKVGKGPAAANTPAAKATRAEKRYQDLWQRAAPFFGAAGMPAPLHNWLPTTTPGVSASVNRIEGELRPVDIGRFMGRQLGRKHLGKGLGVLWTPGESLGTLLHEWTHVFQDRASLDPLASKIARPREGAADLYAMQIAAALGIGYPGALGYTQDRADIAAIEPADFFSRGQFGSNWGKDPTTIRYALGGLMAFKKSGKGKPHKGGSGGSDPSDRHSFISVLETQFPTVTNDAQRALKAEWNQLKADRRTYLDPRSSDAITKNVSKGRGKKLAHDYDNASRQLANLLARMASTNVDDPAADARANGLRNKVKTVLKSYTSIRDRQANVAAVNTDLHDSWTPLLAAAVQEVNGLAPEVSWFGPSEFSAQGLDVEYTALAGLRRRRAQKGYASKPNAASRQELAEKDAEDRQSALRDFVGEITEAASAHKTFDDDSATMNMAMAAINQVPALAAQAAAPQAELAQLLADRYGLEYPPTKPDPAAGIEDAKTTRIDALLDQLRTLADNAGGSTGITQEQLGEFHRTERLDKRQNDVLSRFAAAHAGQFTLGGPLLYQAPQFLGSFAHGTQKRVMQGGLAELHKDETVVPDPDGPWGRRGGGGGGGPMELKLTLDGDLAAITGIVRAEVDGVEVKVSQEVGRRGRRMRAARAH